MLQGGCREYTYIVFVTAYDDRVYMNHILQVVMGEYTWITFEEMFTRMTQLGSGLLANGQKPRKNILIFAETRAEWMIAAQACFKYNFPGTKHAMQWS